MVSVQIEAYGNSLPPYPQEGDWVTIPQSPIPAGLRDFIGRVYEHVEPVDPARPVDLGVWLAPATQPIENLRLSLRELGFPSGEYVGAVFERRVAARPLLYYRRRNTAGLIVELASDAQFRYVIRWTPATGGPRTAVDILVTPSSLLSDSTGWAEHLTRWLDWAYPMLAGVLTTTISPEIRVALETRMAVIPVYGGLVRYA